VICRLLFCAASLRPRGSRNASYRLKWTFWKRLRGHCAFAQLGRIDVSDGSNSTELSCPHHVRFTPGCDRGPDILIQQLRWMHPPGFIELRKTGETQDRESHPRHALKIIELSATRYSAFQLAELSSSIHRLTLEAEIRQRTKLLS
jgi:hypothetical protein